MSAFFFFEKERKKGNPFSIISPVFNFNPAIRKFRILIPLSRGGGWGGEYSQTKQGAKFPPGKSLHVKTSMC
jgi:hypothetical protein